MSLFQTSVLRAHLRSFDPIPAPQAYAVYRDTFLPKIANIRRSKEEQYQYGFLDDLFVSLVQQDEWEAYFNAYKTELTELQREIDAMVYELYGLSDEEIAIIEGEYR